MTFHKITHSPVPAEQGRQSQVQQYGKGEYGGQVPRVGQTLDQWDGAHGPITAQFGRREEQGGVDSHQVTPR